MTQGSAVGDGHGPCDNQLLAALAPADLHRLTKSLERVPMALGDMLYDPGEQLQHAYFPTTSIVSLHYVAESGASAETASVGREGVVGVSLFLGGNTTPSSAVVQTAGCAYRVEVRLLRAEFEHNSALRAILLRYAQALLTQACQNAACYRHHTLEQQLCRWLLVTLDRIPSGHLVMTQELVARMLGVRREGVSEAAGHLQQAGFISYRRGHISVLQRAGLEARVCECYGVVKREMDRLLPTARRDEQARAVYK